MPLALTEKNMFCPRPVCTVIFTALAVLLLWLPRTASSAENVPTAVLIIDGSGSMWGRINKREKIVIARQRLAENIKQLKGVVNLGVMSYGHRRRRDCRDIEMIVPIGPVDPVVYGDAIKRLLPRGKTPVASALDMAAKALAANNSTQGKNRKSHIILVADGVENCRRDPCETTSRLASLYPGLQIDVIGFGVNDIEADQLQCINKNTRGHFYKADNARELTTAIKTIFTTLGQSVSPRIIEKKRRKRQSPPGLYLSASLSRDTPPLSNNISWRIYRAGESSRTGATPLNRETRAMPVIKLPKGKYHIEAHYRGMMTRGTVEVSTDKAVKLRLSFNVGIVTASARLSSTAPPLTDVIFSLYDISAGPATPGNIIAHKQRKKAVFYLAPGKYTLKARANETESLLNFTLKAGERKTRILTLNAGKISLTARLSPDMPALENVQYTLYQRHKEGDIEFVRTLDPTPTLILPAGNYFVLARQEAATSYSKLTVRAGETRTVALNLEAGILKLTSNLDEIPAEQNAQEDQARVAYTIQSAEPVKPKTIKLSSDGSLMEVEQSLPTRSFRNSFVLPAGDYLVHALYGNSNARASTRVQVVAGRQTHKRINMSAGRIKLSLVLAAGNPPLPGVFWSIFDKSGKQVTSASSVAPHLTLSEGSYLVVADYLGQSYRTDFSVNNGDDKNIQLKAQ